MKEDSKVRPCECVTVEEAQRKRCRRAGDIFLRGLDYMSGRLYELCRGIGCSKEQSDAYRALWDKKRGGDSDVSVLLEKKRGGDGDVQEDVVRVLPIHASADILSGKGCRFLGEPTGEVRLCGG